MNLVKQHMERNAERARNRKAQIRSILAHPKWSSGDDYYLLLAKRRGESLLDIADELDKSTQEVTQRWHKLRDIKGLDQILENRGVSTTPYAQEEC